MTLLIVVMAINSTSSWANLYNCKQATGRPIKANSDFTEKLRFSSTSPFIKDNIQNFENLKSKTPYLIYYSIDSSEAFMQFSVRYEVARLIRSCKDSSKVNFVGIINSLYTEKNQIIVCKERKFSYLDLGNFADLDKNLKIKRKAISTDDHTDEELGPLKFAVRYSRNSNKAFGKYPLAHPDFLYELIKFVSTQKEIFGHEKYAPFISLKSHGSKDNVLAGMQECQSEAKQLSAKTIINKILSKNEIRYLEEYSAYEKIAVDILKYEKIISKIELGDSRGTGSFNIESDLGQSRLGQSRLGQSRLSSAAAGLGVGQGLGAEFSFGTAHVHLNWVLQELFDSGSDKTLGFLMLESCDTNRDPDLFHSYLDNVMGFYSAKKSLWYRNLNWWELLENANDSAEDLVKILKVETSKIPNIEVVNN